MTISNRSIRRRLAEGIHGRVRRLSRDRSGMGAVEFAILLPLMITTYIGVAEITDGFMIKRKVDNAASALGDLVTRTKLISASEMQNILDAAEAVIAPYNANNMTTKVTCAIIDDDKVATVAWGEARNDTKDTVGATLSPPEGVTLAGSKLVIAEVHYNYTPAIGYVISGSVDLSEVFYFKPRDDNTVCYDGACC